jgi:hypothetical protein
MLWKCRRQHTLNDLRRGFFEPRVRRQDVFQQFEILFQAKLLMTNRGALLEVKSAEEE